MVDEGMVEARPLQPKLADDCCEFPKGEVRQKLSEFENSIGVELVRLIVEAKIYNKLNFVKHCLLKLSTAKGHTYSCHMKCGNLLLDRGTDDELENKERRTPVLPSTSADCRPRLWGSQPHNNITKNTEFARRAVEEAPIPAI